MTTFSHPLTLSLYDICAVLCSVFLLGPPAGCVWERETDVYYYVTPNWAVSRQWADISVTVWVTLPCCLLCSVEMKGSPTTVYTEINSVTHWWFFTCVFPGRGAAGYFTVNTVSYWKDCGVDHSRMRYLLKVSEYKNGQMVIWHNNVIHDSSYSLITKLSENSVKLPVNMH